MVDASAAGRERGAVGSRKVSASAHDRAAHDSARDHLSKADAVLVAQVEAALPALATARVLVQRFTDIPRWDGCRPPQTASQCAKVVVFKATQAERTAR